MAKNHLLRWARLYANGFDLSGDARTFASVENMLGEIDLTGWSEAVHNFIDDGYRQVGLRGFQALLNDAAGRAFAILKTNPTGVEISLLLGGGAEPVAGDPAYLLGAAQFQDRAGLDGGAFVINADFLPQAGVATDHNPWGVVLHPATSLSATTNGSTIDQAAGSTNGAHANLHMTASSGGTWAFTVEHSTNGSAWSTLMAFTINGSAIASERATVTGTVNRYVRAVATRTSGTVTPVFTFARN
ncbi:MAG: hypothetical protein IT318_23805 [Anaerolineales bacterium]|nr:hypothetical protein [Anaerolineales bacterium]